MGPNVDASYRDVPMCRRFHGGTALVRRRPHADAVAPVLRLVSVFATQIKPLTRALIVEAYLCVRRIVAE